jgi:cyclophilin family peptidyl-prolyl cis-trans isomerase
MIQGGGFEKTADAVQEKQSRAPIENEAKNGLKNRRGTIAMARTSAPHSASSQFFINVADNSNLDHPSFDGWGYAVFGTVTDGMEVVDKIKAQATTIRKLVPRLPDGRLGRPTDFKDVPATDVVITKATVAGEDAAPAAEETPEPEEDDEPDAEEKERQE